MADKYVDMDTLKYLLYDVHQLDELLERERFQDHDKESLDLFLDSTKTFASKNSFPTSKRSMNNPPTTKTEQYMCTLR